MLDLASARWSFMIWITLAASLCLLGKAEECLMEEEARAFLRSLPAQLQQLQEEAVRRAITGDYTALLQVRNSRNATDESLDGVITQEIDGAYRLYRPEGCDDAPLPVLIYLHGGGWCFGSINSCARFCAELSRRAGIAVLAVEYPLAPEHPYPAALNACTDAVAFSHKHAAEYGFDPDHISIGGDSSGGNLALATALNIVLARRYLGPALLPVHSLVLFYPVTKAWADNSPTWQKYAEGYGLDAGLMDAFNAAYTGKADARLPLFSPGVAPDKLLRELPRTLIVNADYDILRSQGVELAKRLTELGVPVRHRVLPNTVHLFITVSGQPSAFGKSVSMAAAFLREKMEESALCGDGTSLRRRALHAMDESDQVPATKMIASPIRGPRKEFA